MHKIIAFALVALSLAIPAEARRYHPTGAERAMERAAAARVKASVSALEKRTAQRFSSLSDGGKLAFLLAMPKGGDLHNHLSGAIYAESYIGWAADKGLCIERASMALAMPPCDPAKGTIPASDALSSQKLMNETVDAWSMRNFQGPGHDHFFEAFGKFSLAGRGMGGKMLAEAVSRAARGHLIYLELMLTPDNGKSADIGKKVGWDGNFESTAKALKENGILSVPEEADREIQAAEAEKNKLLKCGRADADPGCDVTLRYIFQVSRAASPGQVFAQMLGGFASAARPGSKVVGINLVQPEDSATSLKNFTLEMRMLDYLKSFYPSVHISLHAGELAPGLVPPTDLSFHIRESVEMGHAERIGHGVDVMHEYRASELLDEMARKKILVEICLTSNDKILGVKGANHPLTEYLRHGVPTALATDDEGISRSEISMEYYKAATEQKMTYPELKKMARNSLTYSFLPGANLWRSEGIAVQPCLRDLPPARNLTESCRSFLDKSPKANLQFELEQEFREFEIRQ